MDKSLLSVATITLVRNNAEERLLCDALQQLAKLNIPVFITDGGSGNAFQNFLKSIPVFHVSAVSAKGVFAQAKNSLSEAYQYGSEYIFYTEPDKKDFFQNGMLHMIDNIVALEQSGIITASRSAAAFATFPMFQQMTETAINQCCAEVIGNPADYTYGPFILKRQLVPYLGSLHEDVGWGWRPFMFGIAKKLGYIIQAFEGDYFCLHEQQEDNTDERLYRIRQLSQNIQGLLLSESVSLTKQTK